MLKGCLIRKCQQTSHHQVSLHFLVLSTLESSISNMAALSLPAALFTSSQEVIDPDPEQ